jgi:hypothetical protein
MLAASPPQVAKFLGVPLQRVRLAIRMGVSPME